MTQPSLTPHRAVAERIRELRKKRGWSAAHLATELQKVGIPWDRSIVASFELGRRATVTVEELFGLAYVLSVAPVHLVVPTLDADDQTPYQLAPDAPPTTAAHARNWIRGLNPADTDPRVYFTEVPETEWMPEGTELSPVAGLVKRPTWKPPASGKR